MQAKVSRQKADNDSLMDTNGIKDAFAFAMDQHRKGDLIQAEKAYRQIIDTVPNHAGSIHGLGLVLYQRGNVEEAIAMYRRALEIAPNYDEAYNNLGVALESQDHLSEAYDAYQQALQLKPDYAIAHNNLGDVLRKQRRLPEAEKAYREAVRLETNYPLAYVNLGSALWGQGRIEEAEKAFRQAVEFKPDYAQAWNGLGGTMRQQRRLADAIEAFHTALRIQPDYPDAQNNLGLALAAQGDMQAAMACYRKAIELDPDYTPAYESLAGSRRYGPEDTHEISHLQTLVDSPKLSQSSRMSLHFALGKMLDDCGVFDQAFEHYRSGNRLKRETVDFSREEYIAEVSETITAFSRQFFRQKLGSGDPSELPVFIVGVPRSGTTLVEQIIASHPQVFGADELPYMLAITTALPTYLHTNTPYPSCVTMIDEPLARSLAKDYLKKLQAIGGNALRVSDKMPGNYFALGLIALLFPRARVIHCRRDPLDVCLSIYFHRFAHGHGYAYDLADIAVHYCQYERLVQHWREVLPLDMCEVQYEELVTNLGSVSRRLIDYCGLPWDDRCLEYYKNDRAVRSMSHWQVRQPIYTRSVNRWRNYEKYLGPLKKSLGTQTDIDFG